MGVEDGNVEEVAAVDIEVDAFRRLFPFQYYERHLKESIRPDARPLGTSRTTFVTLGDVSSADGSASVKIGSTTMLAAIKMEVIIPSIDSPDEGCLAIEFHMPPVSSPLVRPGRPAEGAPVIAKQLSDVILSSGMINLKELSLICGKAAWMAYLKRILSDAAPMDRKDIYCLDADGSLFDAALLSAVAAFSSLCIPVVSMNDEGKVIALSVGNKGNKTVHEPLNKERRKLTLSCIPFSLTCILHKKFILADPNSEEESIMETLVTVVLDSSNRLISLFKPGGPFVASTSVVQGCIGLARDRVKELHQILNDAISVSEMEVDE